MKKCLTAALSVILLLALALPVFAADSVAVGFYVTGLATPVSGEKVPASPAEGLTIKILANVEGKEKTQELSAMASAAWAETDQANTPLPSGTAFVAGRSYRFTVTLEFMDAAPVVKEGETEFLINGEKAKHLSNIGEKIQFYADFVATPGDFTPEVSLTADGEKTKAYDGKGVTLTAEVEKTEGIDYTYAWYREDKLLEGETGDSLTVKNVSDSGEYYCKVTASLASDGGGGQTKTTKSASTKITITPCIVTVDIRDAEKNLFDPDPEFTYEILGEPYDEMTGSLSRKEGEDIGKYTIGIGTLAFPENAAKNYEIRVKEGTLSIIDVDKLPFVAVENIADQSYITGRSGAKIRISATKGSIPEGAIVSLSIPEADTKKQLEAGLSAKVMKSFTVALLDSAGQKLEWNRHASMRIQIPLSEEEETFKPETILAGLYDSSASSLSCEVVQNGEVIYISLQIDSLGTVALFEGEPLETKTENKPSEKEEEEKGGALWMWILIVLLSLGAIGAIVFTVLQTRKNQKKQSSNKPVKKTPLTAEEQKEKERARRIAEHLNSLPPVPEAGKKQEQEKASPTENEMRTRVVPLGGTEKPETPPKTPPKSTVPKDTKPDGEKQSSPRVISFEDLEE